LDGFEVVKPIRAESRERIIPQLKKRLRADLDCLRIQHKYGAARKIKQFSKKESKQCAQKNNSSQERLRGVDHFASEGSLLCVAKAAHLKFNALQI
jgi:hypothetical protein